MTIQSEIQALKCADCARSDSAVSDLKPDSLLPIPADALTGWRDGRPGADGRDAPQAAAQRRARLRSRVRSDPALVRAGLGVGCRTGRRADAAEPRRRLPERRQRRAQLLRPDERRASTPSTSRCRPTIARVLGDGTGAAVGTTRHAQHRRRTSRSPTSSSRAPARTGTSTPRASTRSTATAPAARLRSRDHPGGRLQPAQPLALREPRLLVRRCARAAADRVARTLAGHATAPPPTRCRRSRSTPACRSRSAR